mgnify:CR=1 FL=1
MRITTLCLILLFSCARSFAETSLWHVSNGEHSLYLGGTIHMLRPRDYPLPVEYDQALAQVDSLVLEINFAAEDMAAFQQTLMTRASYQNDGSLENTLSQAAWNSLQRYCERRGIDVYNMNNFKPVLVMLALFEVERHRLGISATGVDMWYDQQARQRGIPVHGLETLEEQTVFLLGMGVGNESAFMEQSVRDLEQLGPLMAQMIEAWRRGDQLSLDFTGCAPQVAGPINIALPTSIACVYVAIKHIFPSLPANAGVMKPIEITVPEHSLLSAEFPAPTGGYTETILRMIDVIFSAASQAAPDRVVANAYGTINALSIAGKKSNGQRWVMFSFYGGGHGGTPEGNGLNHGSAPISMATIPPVEILEAAYPVAFRQWALREGSAGAGKHRGGLGAVYEIEVLEENGAEGFFFGERGKFPPKGVAGGGDSSATVRKARE